MPQSRMSPALIAIDWGSSSFRAYLLSADGEVLEEMASGDGIASVAEGAYPATLRRLVGRWLEANPTLPVIASGMVGSRHGWREAPYVPCPAGARDVAERLTAVEAEGPAGRARAGPVLRGRGRRGRDAGRGDGNLRRRRRRRKDHRAARLAFQMGEDRRRARRRFQDVYHRRTVRRAARPHRRRRLRQGGARQRARTGVRARGRARRGGGGRQDEVRPAWPPVRRARAAADEQA